MCPFWYRYFWWGSKRALNLFRYSSRYLYIERGANIATISVYTLLRCRRTQYYMLRHINFNALILTKQITICNMLWADNVFYYGFLQRGIYWQWSLYIEPSLYIYTHTHAHTGHRNRNVHYDGIKFNRTWSTKLCRIVGFAYFAASEVFCAWSTCIFFFYGNFC